MYNGHKKIKSQKEALLRKKNVIETLAFVQENLVLKSDCIKGTSQYKKPCVKKVQILKPTKKVYMGCWQQSYAENDGDGC